MEDFTIVSLGDHCVVPLIMKELGKRKTSYPFDWISHKDHLYSTNIFENIQHIQSILDGTDVKTVVTNLFGDALESNERMNTITKAWFPHDKEDSKNEILEKYERRFTRLCKDIQTTKTCFFLITRHLFIDQIKFDNIFNFCMKFNPENKIVFISGTNHEYLNDIKYKDKVIFKFIYYDIQRFYQYDYDVFRPEIKKFIVELFN